MDATTSSKASTSMNSTPTNSTMNSLMSPFKKLWWWLRQITGDAAYENYLSHRRMSPQDSQHRNNDPRAVLRRFTPPQVFDDKPLLLSEPCDEPPHFRGTGLDPPTFGENRASTDICFNLRPPPRSKRPRPRQIHSQRILVRVNRWQPLARKSISQIPIAVRPRQKRINP